MELAKIIIPLSISNFYGSFHADCCTFSWMLIFHQVTVVFSDVFCLHFYKHGKK